MQPGGPKFESQMPFCRTANEILQELQLLNGNRPPSAKKTDAELKALAGEIIQAAGGAANISKITDATVRAAFAEKFSTSLG
jgi:hypothetical protein